MMLMLKVVTAPMTTDEGLSSYLRRAREAAGYSSPERVEEAARQRGLRIRGRTIRQIERPGGTGRPEQETLAVLAEVYRIDLRDLLHRAGYAVEMGPPPDITRRGQYVGGLFDRLADEDKVLIENLVQRLADALTGGTEGPSPNATANGANGTNGADLP